MKGISGRKLRGCFLTLLVVIGLVLGMSLTVQAESGENSCGDGVTWSYDSGTNILSINYSGSGTGVMTDYDNNTQGSAPPWYDHHKEIKTISIDSGVTHIGNFAFENFLFLTEVTIPQGVVSIGVDAFCKCNSLTQVTIPSGVTSIGTAAFSACTTLKQITIPSSVTSIGNAAFAGCVLLNCVTFEEPTKEAGLSVGTSAFPVSEGNVSSPAIAYTGTGSLVLFDGDTQITTDNTAGDLNDKSLTWEVAGKRYPLWVGKTRVTENTMQGTGWSYNAADNILTLSGATITEGYSPDEYFAYGIYYFGSDELKIALTDKNTIGSMNAGLYGGINIVGNAALNIYGEGELTAYGTFFGIGGWKEIKIVGGTINAFGTGDDGIGISSDGDLTISGGTVNASGSNVTGIGISCNKSVIINGGVVTASGGYSGITAGKVKNAIAGTGWEDMAGTQGGTTIAVSTEGQQLGNNLKKVKFEPSHVHSFTYSVTGATITATCTANGCTLPPSTEGGSDHVATLTIGAPAMTTYGGTGSAEATITDDNGIQGDAKINYQEKTGESTYDTATETAPTDAGTYKAGITLGEGNGAATASVEYTIEKADPAATAPTATATYGQTLADVTLTNPEGNTPGTWAWVDSTQSVGNVVSPAATFKANFTPTSSNYKTVENVNVSVTINKAAPTVTAPTAKTLTYTGTAQELVNAGSATGGTMYYAMSTEKTPPTDENLYTTSIPTATDIGT